MQEAHVASHAYPKKLYVYDGDCEPGISERELVRSMTSSTAVYCSCSDTALADSIAESYDIEVEKIERPCACVMHCKGDSLEYRRAAAVYPNSYSGAYSAGAFTSYLSTAGYYPVTATGATPSTPVGVTKKRFGLF